VILFSRIRRLACGVVLMKLWAGNFGTGCVCAHKRIAHSAVRLEFEWQEVKSYILWLAVSMCGFVVEGQSFVGSCVG